MMSETEIKKIWLIDNLGFEYLEEYHRQVFDILWNCSIIKLHLSYDVASGSEINAIL